MKTGKQLSEIAALVHSAHKAKKDYVASTSALRMTTVNANTKNADVALEFSVGDQSRIYTPTSLCLNQIAQHTGIPTAYADRMRVEAPELLAANVNTWFAKNNRPRMLRTLSNGTNVMRAFLSDTYRPFDNYDLFAAIMPHLEASGCVVRSAEVTETRLYIQASTPRISRPINQTITINNREERVRVVEAGVIIGNSEVGCGSVFVDPILYDNWCTNGMVMQRTLKRRHVGGRNRDLLGEDGEAAEILFSDETRQQDDKAFWMKVRDVVTNTIQGSTFNALVDRLVATQNQSLKGKPSEVVELLGDRLKLGEEEKENVLLHYMQGGDTSKFGLIQAVTRAAQDCESYDRAVELERLGGGIIELPPSDFSKN